MAGVTTLPVTARVGRISASTGFQVTVAPTGALRFGVHTPSGLHGGTEPDAVTALVGEAPGIVPGYAELTRELDVAGCAPSQAGAPSPCRRRRTGGLTARRPRPERSRRRLPPACASDRCGARDVAPPTAPGRSRALG